MATPTQTQLQAIPTDYAGHRFRSRLEAKWAAFFDLLGWPWEYEPIDLNGYIPDFVLLFSAEPLLVEVKPVLYQKDFAQYWPKIMNSGWEHEAMIVGSLIFKETKCWDYPAVLGSLAQRNNAEHLGIPDWSTGAAILERCTKCGRISLFHDTDTWFCRVNGCYDGDGFLDPIEYEQGRQLFAQASRFVRYNSH